MTGALPPLLREMYREKHFFAIIIIIIIN
jgi:hypothetical protein